VQNIILARDSMKKPEGVKIFHPDEFILGIPGSGKAFKTKLETIQSILSLGDEVLIIDPEQEYEKFIKKFNKA